MLVFAEFHLIRFLPIRPGSTGRLCNSGAYVGVRLTSGGSMWHVECNLIDKTEVLTVFLGVIRSGGKWQSDITRLVATALSCVNSISVECGLWRWASQCWTCYWKCGSAYCSGRDAGVWFTVCAAFNSKSFQESTQWIGSIMCSGLPEVPPSWCGRWFILRQVAWVTIG